MSTQNITPTAPDRRVLIEAAIARGRAERSKAFWALLKAVFGRKGTRPANDAAAAPDHMIGATR